MNKTKHKKKIIAALVCLNLLFIWGNSLLDGETSTRISDAVTKSIENVLCSDAKDDPDDSYDSGKPTDIPEHIENADVNADDGSDAEEALVEPSESGDESDEVIYFRYILTIVVRKCAHIAEFLLLAVWLMLLLEKRIQTTLLCGVLTALIDETIQLFTGRTSCVSDVWIDIGGFSAGMLLVLLFEYISKRKAKGDG